MTRALADELERPVTFALEDEADYRAVDVTIQPDGTSFTICGPEFEVAVRSPLPGSFNVYNALGGLAAGRALGISLEAAVDAIETATPIPGRFERLAEGQSFEVVVDYAHSPHALASALQAVREMIELSRTRNNGRVPVVFGCDGERDRGKRAIMGRVASRLADRVIVTSDNPRSEHPEEIIEQIAGGAVGWVRRNVDRRAAIAEAIAGARRDDIVVIAR